MDDTNRLHTAIAPKAVRYIKLGAEGAAAAECFAQSVVRLGFADIPQAPCLAGDWEAVRARFIAAGKSPQKASDHTRELRDFYTLGEDALWVTFASGHLWWTFAASEVTWDPRQAVLPRVRRTLAPWRSSNICGTQLALQALSTRLTSVRAYRGTLCEIKAQDYLLRKINGEPEPLIVEAEAARAALLAVAIRLITELHEKEFELLVDLIFAQSGWRRISVLGETQADVDLLLEQTATGERAFVQVKSRATPAILRDYVDRFRDYRDCERMFFVCHSPSDALAAHTPIDGVEFWFLETLAAKTMQAGLLDWLIARVR